MRLEVKKKLTARSDRVKSVDVHPTEPWILSSLYNGQVYLWNYQTQNLVKSFELTDLPVRSAKFIARKQWLIAGCDDMHIRVYNYNTMEKVKDFEAHTDYIRSLAIHPTQPLVLSSSDDMSIKCWDWEKNWTCVQIFEGHTHYVMMVVFNPKDTNTFASASLDRTIKVWGLGANTPHFTLEGHDKGVNCIDYFIGGEKPYLVSGGDDKLAKVWDYQNKTCVQTLDGHTHNVSAIAYHPELPVIITGSEDGTVRLWHSNTYRLEKNLNYGMERVWAFASLKGTNLLAVGYDEGSVMLKLGREEPAVSMDQTGKVIWAKHSEIQTVNVKTTEGVEYKDGERLPLAAKELGNCEIYPQTLQHNPNGRFVVVCGDGEYVIFTALAWRNKTFGSALDFVWAAEGTGDYAVRESSSKVKTFKNFKESKNFKPNYSAEQIFGGHLIAVKGKDFICFYDWEECRLVRRIDVTPKAVYWSEDGARVCIATESSFFVLKYNKDTVQAIFAAGGQNEEEGIDDAFIVENEIAERVRTATWVGDCFIYTNANNRLNYCVSAEPVTIAHLDRHMYILGYIPAHNKIYLVDKSLNIVSYTLHLSVINYQTAVLRGDMETASSILPKIPEDHRTRIAQFLETQGFKEQALEVSVDPDHRFELAVQLNRLELATELAGESPSEHKWRQLADLAISACKFDLAERCLLQADDLSALLLLYTSTGDAGALAKLAENAKEKGVNNIAFVCYYLLRRVDAAIQLLTETNRIPEAALLARTYAPSRVSEVVREWRKDLQSVSEKAAESLADPAEYENLFPDFRLALLAEQKLQQDRRIPATSYMRIKDLLEKDIVGELKAQGFTGYEEGVSLPAPKQNGAPATSPTAALSSSSPTSVSSPQRAPAPSPVTPNSPAPAAVSSPAVPTPSKPTPAPAPVATPAPAPVATPVSAPTATPSKLAPTPTPVTPATPAPAQATSTPATASPRAGSNNSSPTLSPQNSPRPSSTSAPAPAASVAAPAATPSPAKPSTATSTPVKVASLIDFDDEEDDLAAEIEAQLREEEGKSD